MSAPIDVYHIPVCPFSQRLEILLSLKGQKDAVNFHVVDITKPRDASLLAKTDGTTALPVLETTDGDILKESLVILQYIDEMFGASIRQKDPLAHAVENMLIAKEGPFTMAGYLFVMNQNKSERQAHLDKLLGLYRDINTFLNRHAPEGPFLFEDFGLAEAVFTPMFMRFWFLEYYEDFALPDGPDFARVAAWRNACLAHPAAQQVSKEEIVKLYFDYALGYGNGALPEGRTVSSFVFEPDWPERPWPPQDKYTARPSDAELGLLG
ncbi:glutathione S-transferase family protein [Halocynthiibacter sp. C4]|uniref:glutathione S-transferase family protein n=1 Tax=Halocynthiibacter sp. C4 TaxID=2992758 RepID=UPI00237C2747|nr:glutathione S-transferase family protein [Halocynthiibacter sp. C4]MDE0589449.1 glutathione S-transferase family protein [Halocynthiibacter sp. C4]